MQEAIRAVEKAERTISQEDVDSAWKRVNRLPRGGKTRNELSDRLNIVQEQIFAIKRIKEDIENMTDLNEKGKIQEEINKLPKGDIRDELQDMLDKK